MKKLISVIMPVFNGESYLFEAIESILQQTYSNFELIIINDGSTDSTLKICNSFDDCRIKIISTEQSGLVQSLNTAFSNSCGEYIARMDADDICMPNRFMEQVQVLDSQSNIGIVCSDIIRISETGKNLGQESYKIVNSDHFLEVLLGNKKGKPIVHPSVMMRRDVLEYSGGYRNYHAAEDRDLWLRCIKRFEVYRINKPLLKYRINSQGVSLKSANKQIINSSLCVINYLIFSNKNRDMYVEFPDQLENFKGEIEGFVFSKVLPHVSDFRNLKIFIRNKEYISGLLFGLNCVIKYGVYFYPDLNRYRLNRYIRNFVDIKNK